MGLISNGKEATWQRAMCVQECWTSMASAFFLSFFFGLISDDNGLDCALFNTRLDCARVRECKCVSCPKQRKNPKPSIESKLTLTSRRVNFKVNRKLFGLVVARRRKLATSHTIKRQPTRHQIRRSLIAASFSMFVCVCVCVNWMCVCVSGQTCLSLPLPGSLSLSSIHTQDKCVSVCV